LKKKLFLLHRAHPYKQDEFYQQSVRVREVLDTPESLKKLKQSMNQTAGSTLIIRGEIIAYHIE